MLPAPIDSASYARSVREDTAQLASYVLSDKKDKRSASFLRRKRSSSSNQDSNVSTSRNAGRQGTDDGIIDEGSEPSSPETVTGGIAEGHSVLSSMLKHSPPETDDDATRTEDSLPNGNGSQAKDLRRQRLQPDSSSVVGSMHLDGVSESTPLLRTKLDSCRLPDSPDLSEGDEMSDVGKPKI